MKHTLRNILIWTATMSGLALLYRQGMRAHGPLVRVIAFHDVTDSAWFEKVMATLVSKYNVITPEQFRKKEFNAHKINVLITFDDGYQSWTEHCAPVLRKHHVQALFFIVSGLIDVARDKIKADDFMRGRLFITPRAALSWDGVRKLISDGHTVGGHTRSHSDLSKLSDVQLQEEISGDRVKIESELHTQITDFAYPFGQSRNYNDKVLKSVKGVGYTHGYVAEPGFFKGDTHQYEIPRTLIEAGQSAPSVCRWIDGGYDVFHSLKVLLRSRAT